MKYVVARDEQVLGAYDRDTLLALLTGGTLKLTDQCWDSRKDEWRLLHEFLEDRSHAWVGTLVWKLLAVVLGMAFLVTAAAALWLAGKPRESAQSKPSDTAPISVSEEAKKAESNTQPMEDAARELKRLTEELESAGAERAKEQPKSPQPVEAPKTAEMAKPVDQPKQASPAAAGKAKLEVVNVEPFDDEVAVTLLNSGSTPVSEVSLTLKYHALPPPHLRLESLDGQIQAVETRMEATQARAKEAGALIEELKAQLAIVSQEPEKWNNDLLDQVPAKEEWARFGNDELTESGAALHEISREFLKYIRSEEENDRRYALQRVMGQVQQKMLAVKTIIERLLPMLQQAGGLLQQEVKKDQAERKALADKRAQLEPQSEKSLKELRAKILKTEDVTLQAEIPPGTVKRLVLKRAPNPDWGVMVDGKTNG